MALPATLNPGRPLGTDSVNDPASTIDNQIRALKQLIADLFGIPVDPTSLTAAGWSQTAGGLVSVAQPVAHRVAGVLDRTTTNVSSSGATETTVYTFTLLANTLGTTNHLRLVILGSYSDPTAAETYIWRFKYAGTTLFSRTVVTVDNNAVNAVISEFHLCADGATNSQVGWMTTICDDGTTIITRAARGTAAVDSTSNQTLSVTVQGTADVGSEFTLEYAFLEFQP